MARENNAVKLRRALLAKLARLMREGRLAEGVDGIPFEMTRGGWEVTGCCVHHDRALIRLRLLAMLGLPAEGLSDVERPLSECAAAAGEERPRGEFPLTMVTEACNACAKTRYLVTDACQGCLARPCQTGCPKGAVGVRDDRSHIDAAKCASCGLCEKACPFHAIVRVPVPCEEACPAGAIRKLEDGTARIDEEKCVLCGRCIAACPFGAPMERSEMARVIARLAAAAGAARRRAVAIVAPAAMAQFPFPAGKFAAALRALGFDDVVEAAEGADIVAREEAEELARGAPEGGGMLATSCCPSWVRAAGRIPGMAEKLSSAPSPMVAAGRLAKGRDPDAFTVFISPCVAKRWEAHKPDLVMGGEGRAESDGRPEAAPRPESGRPVIDAVLTSEEVGTMFLAAGIEVNEAQAGALLGASAEGRGFGAAGGASNAIARELEALKARGTAVPELCATAVAGLTPASLAAIGAMKPAGEGKVSLLEVMSCEGGCLGGPCTIANQKVAKVFLDKYKAGLTA
ncbi:4Fe-4S binding protein [bacterium]|nr:4Fe-4S binding protein [bacterium]